MTTPQATVTEIRPDAARNGSEARREALNQFLAGVERRAFRKVRLAVGNDDDALELVQDAMLKLTRSYSDQPEAEWPLIFQRILQNVITDFHRRQNVRSRVLSWVRFRRDEDESEDDMEVDFPDPAGRSPLENLLSRIATEQLLQALERLPVRQQQAFVLRFWDGLDTAETAYAMSCTEGSVKTHLSRALGSLRETLEEFAP